MNPILRALVVTGGFAAAPLSGQTVHLAPLPEVTFAETDALLRIRPPAARNGNNLLARREPTIRIAAGRMYVSHRDSAATVIELGDRTLAEFVAQLRARYEGVGFSTDFPELSTRYLREGDVTTKGSEYKIGGRTSPPVVRGLLGLGFSLNETRRDPSTNRLLRNAGLHLDVVGTKQYRRVNLRSRIGIRSGEAVSVSQPGGEGSQEQPDPDRPASITSIVETAERVTLGLHGDFNLVRRARDLLISAGVEVASSWNALPAFQFRPIPVDGGSGELIPVEDLFDADEVDFVREQLDRVFPLWTLIGGPRMVFGRREEQVFYTQFDIGFSQDPVRTFAVRYRVTSPDDGGDPSRTPDRLIPIMRRPFEPIWRMGLGGTIASLLELRAEATGQIKVRDHEVKPLLRVMIGSNLQLAR